MNFNFTPDSRKALLRHLLLKLEDYYSRTQTLRVSSPWQIEEVKAFARTLNLESGNDPQEVLDHIITGLTNYSVHTPHPNYFGLFNPRTGFASIVADLITATMNPQLAAWSHAPFANEIERYVIKEFGKRFGYKASSIDGTFCSGGAESNETALVCALNYFFPTFSESGIHKIPQQLVIYTSSESHHSIVKATKRIGLGADSIRSVMVAEHLGIDIERLQELIQSDRKKGFYPLMIVGTAGTTGAGSIDNLEAIHRIATKERIWFHIDAAYGGAAILSDKVQTYLAGIGLSDSITLDVHKWFFVPMGASIFLTSHRKILHRSFGIKTKYMPEDGDPNQVIDPYLHSGQWSRRFIGLKIFLPLAVHGWRGYQTIVENQIALGDTFRKMLEARNWEIVNHSPLPIVCFRPKGSYSEQQVVDLVNNINESGRAWLSVYPIRGRNTARICITNYDTRFEDLEMLMNLLEHNWHIC